MKAKISCSGFIKIFTVILFCTLLCSCTENGRKESSVQNISDTLRTSYAAELAFNVRHREDTFEGTAQLLRDGSNVSLDIKSPEPFSGLSIEYDAAGAPSSVAVHFKGIDTTLPSAALTKVNILASLATGDFPEILSKVSGENITEYEYSQDKKGYCARLRYGEADIALCYSENGDEPYSMEYSSEDMYAVVTFTKFKLDITENIA